MVRFRGARRLRSLRLVSTMPSGTRGRCQSATRAGLAFVLAGALGALGGFAPAATAAPTTVSCGSTIAAAGRYVLAADCRGLGIEITASDVTLRLNGHSMTGTGSGTGSGSGVFVFDDAGPLSGLTIKGPGRVAGYDAGVQLGVGDGGVSGSRVSGVTVTRNTDGILLDGGSGNTITNNTANKNVDDGIDLFQATANMVRGNTANNNNHNGIALGGGSANAITNNTTNNNNSDGIAVASGATSNTVSGNTANNNPLDDLLDANPGCDSNSWTGNTFKTASQTCIQ
jgi:parallel beta-helix repeat protein